MHEKAKKGNKSFKGQSRDKKKKKDDNFPYILSYPLSLALIWIIFYLFLMSFWGRQGRPIGKQLIGWVSCCNQNR